MAVKGYTFAMKTAAQLSVVLLFLLTVATAQDHAPTVQQCQADRLLWWDQFDTPEVIATLSYRKLSERSGEMIDCSAVDDEHKESYRRLVAMFQMEIAQRLLSFVTRHHLMAQFMAEDAAKTRQH